MIYFAHAVEIGAIKIGHSINPTRRLAELRSACPSRLDLLTIIPGDQCDEARIHRKFSVDRKRGEWFRFSPALQSFIAGLPLPRIQLPRRPTVPVTPLKYIRASVFHMIQRDFAAAVGVNQSTVSRWERGHAGPDRGEMERIRSLADHHGHDWSDTWFFEVPREDAA